MSKLDNIKYKPKQSNFKYVLVKYKNEYFKSCVLVDIFGEEYEMCDHYSKLMMANSKTGAYGKGIANTKSDPYKVERIGRLGEMAFAKLYDRYVDFTYYSKGDEYDFINDHGQTLDIKTACNCYGSGLIRVQEGSRIFPLGCDYYMFGFLKNENIQLNQASIVIVGWISKNEILKNFNKLVPSKSKYSSHMNYEIPYGSLNKLK